MKNLVYFILLVLLTTSSCKKKEACDGVICQNGGSCVDNGCLCTTGYTGIYCETASNYMDTIKGTWHVYKYLLNNIDKSSLFAQQHGNYFLTINIDSSYSEFYTNPDTSIITGKIHLGDYLETIVFQDSLHCISNASGTQCSLQTSNSLYSVFNLTRTHMQLRTDTSQIYFSR